MDSTVIFVEGTYSSKRKRLRPKTGEAVFKIYANLVNNPRG